MQDRFQLASKQVVFLIIGSTIGTGILTLPRTVAAKAHQDVILAVLLGAMVPLASLLLINYLARQHPGQDFTAVTHELFGKWLGTLILLFYVIYMVCYIGIIIRIFADVTAIFLLRRTPLIVLLLVINLSIGYISCQGGKVVARVSEILFYILCFNYVLMLPPITNIQITNLLPIAEVDWKKLLAGAQVTAFAYGGIEGMLAGVFMMTRPRQFLKAGFIALV